MECGTGGPLCILCGDRRSHDGRPLIDLCICTSGEACASDTAPMQKPNPPKNLSFPSHGAPPGSLPLPPPQSGMRSSDACQTGSHVLLPSRSGFKNQEAASTDLATDSTSHTVFLLPCAWSPRLSRRRSSSR
jgi:hypothetical protein